MTDKLVAGTYKRLVSDIASLYEGARKALVEAYWKIGQRIVEVEQEGAVKAAHGSGLLLKLSEDLTQQCGPGFSYTNLKNMRRFYLDSPNRQPAGDLGWTQHVELLKIGDVSQRKALERKAIREGLKRDDLRELVRHELIREEIEENLSAVHRTPSERPDLLIPPKDLTLHTYRIYQPAVGASETELLIDLGFYCYRELAGITNKKFAPDDIVISSKDAKGNYSLTPYSVPRTLHDSLHAYEATVERVIDGDTLWAVIDAGFGTQVREKLRLRGIDCPELGSPEGEAAKRFVMKLLPQGARCIIKSSKSDKYGRFVADVMLNDKDGKQQHLNNLLLQEGLAVSL